MLVKAKLVLRCVFALSATALVTGCGGESGSQNLTPHAMAMRALVSTAGTTATALFQYAGTLRQTSTGSSPTTFAVVQRVTRRPTTLAGKVVTEYQGVGTENGNGSSLKTNFDAFVAEVTSKIRTGSDVTLVKVLSSDSNGVSQRTVYDDGNRVVDQVPEIPEARWSNSAARSENIVDSVSSSTIDDLYRADGSYDESAIPVEGRTADLHSYSDGSAVYSFPLNGTRPNSSVSFLPPNKKGLLYVWFADAAADPLPATIEYVLRSWYAATPILATDSFENIGLVRVPAACKVPRRYGRVASEIVERMTRLDVTFGQYETTSRTAYMSSPVGLVCLTVHDDLQVRYVYEPSFILSAKVLSETVSDEIVGLQRANITNASLPAIVSDAIPLESSAIWRAAVRVEAARSILRSLQNLRKRP